MKAERGRTHYKVCRNSGPNTGALACDTLRSGQGSLELWLEGREQTGRLLERHGGQALPILPGFMMPVQKQETRAMTSTDPSKGEAASESSGSQPVGPHSFGVACQLFKL